MHAHTVCTRPFFFLPHAKHERLPTREKEGLGTKLCHLHLVLSTCLIALVVVAVNITKSKNIILLDMLITLSEGDKAQKCLNSLIML